VGSLYFLQFIFGAGIGFMVFLFGKMGRRFFRKFPPPPDIFLPDFNQIWIY